MPEPGEIDLDSILQSGSLWKWTRRDTTWNDALDREGRLLSVSGDLIVIAEFVEADFRGLVYLRRDDVVGCARGDTQVFRESAYRQSGVWDSPAIDDMPPLGSLAEVLVSFMAEEEVLIVESEYEDHEKYETFVVGRVQRVDRADEILVLQTLSPNGAWYPEAAVIPFETISSFTWRAPYAEMLGRYGEPQPPPGL